MLFLNYHDKNKFVTNINPDDFKTGIIKSFRIKNCFHIYYFDNQGTFRKYIINDTDIYKYIKPIKQEISRKKYKNYDEYKYYACYTKDLMRLKWTDNKTGEKLSYKIHFKHIYPNGNQKSYYVIKPAFPLPYNSNINQTFLRSAIERLIINKSTLQDMITIYNYIVETSPDNRCIASIVDTKYPTKIQRCESKTDICLNSISSVNDDVKSFIYKIERPIIERQVDNIKTNTFDFIRIRATIPSKTKMPNRKMFIKQNMKDIVDVYMHHLETYKSYKKYNVPTSYLKLSKAIITKADELELLFELKDFN